MTRYAIVDTAAKAVLTVVEHDSQPPSPPPGFKAGVIALAHERAGSDWAWDGSQLVAPPEPEPPTPTVADVKQAARNRILARFPDWKQANMTARGVELVLVLASGSQWSSEEASEAAGLQSAWDWIKAVRAASDELEASSPIPTDFTSDEHWPE